MNAKEIMDLLLKTGREYVDKGVDIVEDKLDIPEDPEARKAMVAAAQADGHIDDTERSKIVDQIKALGLNPETAKAIEAELNEPINLNALARSVDSPEAAAEMYMVSRLILDVDEPQERLYLKELASALGLETDLVNSLEAKLA